MDEIIKKIDDILLDVGCDLAQLRALTSLITKFLSGYDVGEADVNDLTEIVYMALEKIESTSERLDGISEGLCDMRQRVIA